jgi:hypothetical protein
MTEVQRHGLIFENMIVQQRVGISREEYEKLNGYTAPFDLTKGLLIDYNASIKSAQKNTVNCADLLTMMGHTEEYRLIVGCFDQVGKQKVFHTQYEFFIEPKHYDMLWDGMDRVKIEQYVDKIKSIKPGREAQKHYQKFDKKPWKSEVQSKTSFFVINPKVGGGDKQRRVQCSTHLSKLIASGIEYTKENINFIVQSERREFKNK